MVIKLTFKDSSERERAELVEIKEKACLVSLLMDRKALIRVIIGHQKTDEYLTGIKDVD